MNNVYFLRTQKGMTQDEFAEYCNVSRISIARYEANEKISRSNAEKIAKACGVSVSFVIGEQKEQPPNRGLDDNLIDMLVSLSPDQVQRVQDFVAGLKAAHKE